MPMRVWVCVGEACGTLWHCGMQRASVGHYVLGPVTFSSFVGVCSLGMGHMRVGVDLFVLGLVTSSLWVCVAQALWHMQRASVPRSPGTTGLKTHSCTWG